MSDAPLKIRSKSLQVLLKVDAFNGKHPHVSISLQDESEGNSKAPLHINLAPHAANRLAAYIEKALLEIQGI